MWARAVWEEGNKIHEGVVPHVWIENNTVRWPSGLNVRKPYAEKQKPCDNWKTFPLIKIKCSADDKQVCDKYEFTTTAELSDEDDDEEYKKRNTCRRKTGGNAKQILDSSDSGSDCDAIPEFPPPPAKFIQASKNPNRSRSRSRSSLREKENNKPSSKRPNEHFPSSTSKTLSGSKSRSSSKSRSRSKMGSKTSESGKQSLPGKKNTPLTENCRSNNILPSIFPSERRRSRSKTMSRSRSKTWSRSSSRSKTSYGTRSRSKTHSRSRSKTRSRSSSRSKRSFRTRSRSNTRPRPSTPEPKKRSSAGEGSSSERQHGHTFGTENTVARSNSGFPISEARFQRRVLQLLTEIRNTVAQVGKRCSPANSDLQIEQATSLEQLKRLDHSLADKDTRDVLLSRIIDVGGLNVRENVRNVMHRLMNNEVMALMNMKGKGSKFAFGSTKVFQVVIESVVKNQKTTEAVVERAVQQLLKYAPDRQGGGRKETV